MRENDSYLQLVGEYNLCIELIRKHEFAEKVLINLL